MSEIKFNLNQTVKVKLTRVGYQRLADIHNELVGVIPNMGGKSWEDYERAADADGYTRTQLWCLMNDFGSMVGMCMPNPFDLDIILDPAS